MNEFTSKALAVSTIWLATAAAIILAKMESEAWLAFVAAGMTSYYIWTYEPGAAKKVRPDPVEELKRWNDLREKSLITQAEYDAKKADLIE